ncbi:hypothetical protein [Aurantibacter sp.]|uniref:hypothetical protein n=1 Tax=Aurantibacter sp. TaxID=2807103 RepID=UPI0035C799FE
MRIKIIYFIIFLISAITLAQDDGSIKNDSIKRTMFIKQLGQGFLPSKLFNLDLKYLVKYNQYEGFRTGLGGETNETLSDKFRVNGYTVYGFVDKEFKYSIGGGFRVNKSHNTWINYSYTDDLTETGSTKFILDKRLFTFFEPRLLNIDLFHKHQTNRISIEHEIDKKLYTEVEFSISNIDPTYGYSFRLENNAFDVFETTKAKIALQWNPFSEINSEKNTVTKNGYPQFTFQYTKSFKNILGADFNFSKLDFRTIHKIKYKSENAFSLITLTAGLANGDTPLTDLYHAYPNNIRKETVLQRFTVAGINSFETMYFNEFFSDKFTTIIAKHYFKPFRIARLFNPQLVLINRLAIGNISNQERHDGVAFNSLEKGYTEAGIELNKLFFGFGLSTTYRYGAYHLPNEEDNIAIKFTFNITL